MTDRVNALLVVLDKDIREDDVEFLINALRCLRNVCDVKRNVADYNSAIAYSRVKSELHIKLFNVLTENN